jgi:DNA-binding transcriptional LysR family regulator
MLDGLTLDQLRTFIAAADAGSFSAAGRNLGRAQSVVSQTLANLEAQIGIKVFDRAGRLPVLTDAGHALLGEARVVIGGMDQFKAIAKDLAGGLEPELSVAVDVMFPIEVLTCAVSDFQAKFPNTPLRLYVEALGAVIRPVLEGHCAFGIMGSLPIAPPQLKLERLLGVSMIMVASPRHPLAKHRKPIPAPQLSEHIQLVLTDRSDLSRGKEFGVFSSRTWRLADLGAKHAFLRAALGWGSMPASLVEQDIARGELVEIKLQDVPIHGYIMAMSAAYRMDAPPGLAGRWLVERLKENNSVQSNAGRAPPKDGRLIMRQLAKTHRRRAK